VLTGRLTADFLASRAQGADAAARKFRPNGQISGDLDGFIQRTWDASGSSMLVQFTSDETAPQVGEGFEAYYDCV
jgi:hypothetical protein